MRARRSAAAYASTRGMSWRSSRRPRNAGSSSRAGAPGCRGRRRRRSEPRGGAGSSTSRRRAGSPGARVARTRRRPPRLRSAPGSTARARSMRTECRRPQPRWPAPSRHDRASALGSAGGGGRARCRRKEAQPWEREEVDPIRALAPVGLDAYDSAEPPARMTGARSQRRARRRRAKPSHGQRPHRAGARRRGRSSDEDEPRAAQSPGRPGGAALCAGVGVEQVVVLATIGPREREPPDLDGAPWPRGPRSARGGS